VARPDRTLALLAGLSVALIGAIIWSTHHLLLAGVPAYAAGGALPSVSCLLLPLADDLAPHLASYAFMLATAAGAAAGARVLLRQSRSTRALLSACLAVRSPRSRVLDPLERRLQLHGRLDVVDLTEPIAFCYGYIRPRVLVSTGLIDLLPPRELEAVLLHEREHLRRLDPLKVAAGRLLASTGFFVPVLGALYRRFLVEKELAADRAAIAAHGDDVSLSAALIRLVERRATLRPPLGAGAGEALEARIDALLGDPVRRGLQLGAGGFAASLVVASLAALPLLATPLPSDIVASNHNVVAGCHLTTH
jgi:beta-lactamase regulating signal transducer with metallopeptidase domain